MQSFYYTFFVKTQASSIAVTICTVSKIILDVTCKSNFPTCFRTRKSWHRYLHTRRNTNM